MMARNKNAGSTPATDTLVKAGISFKAHTYRHDPHESHYGHETITELGLDPARVLKTLVVEVIGGKTQLAVGVVPVAGMLDLKALAAALKAKKCQMAEPKAAQRSSGYVIGGISPLGQRTKLVTVIDDSVKDYETVFCSGGKRGLSIELSPTDLAKATGAIFAPIGRDSFHS